MPLALQVFVAAQARATNWDIRSRAGRPRVCATHGGTAPQLRATAATRLAALVDPSIGVLDKTLRNSKCPVWLDDLPERLDAQEELAEEAEIGDAQENAPSLKR